MNEAYAAYLKSSTWKERRTRYFKAHERKCRRCYRKKNIHLHHGTYENLGNELDSDLIPLCARCHNYIHKILKQNPNLNLAEMTIKVLLNPSKKIYPDRSSKSSTSRKLRPKRSVRLIS